MDCYNAGVKYLKEKYFTKDELESKFKSLGTVESLFDDIDTLIYLLLGQYYLGVTPKKELHEILNLKNINCKL
jgi:hypothetical protein